MNKLLNMVDQLIDAGHLSFGLQREGRALDAQMSSGRHQRVRLRRVGDEYRLSSTVVGPSDVPDGGAKRRDLLLRIWAKNAATEIVSFGIDGRGRVVGVCRHPVATLDAEELRHYLVALVQECDRFEWVLSGEDRN